ncbi:TLD-domain-containing protein [Rhizophagus diaphanus]|nr:TLD-domain-containing protein [Rhizophagus diaphanus] [Rhizophagus sp. MUCL 43196]
MAPSKKLNINIESPRKPKHVYDSVIIGPQHFAIFSSWIEKKNDSYYTESNFPYKFNLLYRANRDGNTPAAFHAKCDNKGATIVIVKIQSSEQILGGYNPLPWDQNSAYKKTTDSYIFSFTNRNDLNTAKVGYTNRNASYAIYCNQSYGPAFGGGHDLFLDNNNNWNSSKPHSYSEINMPRGNNFGYNIYNVENYEVFQVIKK